MPTPGLEPGSHKTTVSKTAAFAKFRHMGLIILYLKIHCMFLNAKFAMFLSTDGLFDKAFKIDLNEDLTRFN